jgi:hypothetical protein
MKPTVTLVLALLVVGGAEASDVFKSTDANGHPVYTDRPATLPAQKVDVATQSTDEVTVKQRYDEEMKHYQEADKTQKAASADHADAVKTSELSAAAKAKRCEEARTRYQTYMNSRRLYEPGPTEGERRYLDSAEIDAARERALQAMNELCAGL